MNLSPEAVVLRPGMALTLTLNGIAQGYIAVLLASHGLTRARIDTGEMVALPETSWPVQLADREITLQNRALATSAPLGMTFGRDGQTSHILDPTSGRPALPFWHAVSVSAPTAALADALSTAACLMEVKADLIALCDDVAGAILESAIPL